MATPSNPPVNCAKGKRTYTTPCGTAAAKPKAVALPSFTTRAATASPCMPASSSASLLKPKAAASA